MSLEDIHYYKNDKGFELSDAIKRAIKRNGSMLDEVLEDDSDDMEYNDKAEDDDPDYSSD